MSSGTGEFEMNNTQLYLSIGIPTLTVLLAWLSNRSDINRLNDKVDAMDRRLYGRIDDMTQRLSARIDASVEANHKDNLSLMGYMVPLHERMAKLETRT
jgi:hypothetical protein